MIPWKRFIAWIRDEIRLARLETWADESRNRPMPDPNTRDDPRSAAVLKRLEERRREMRRKGIRTLLDGRPSWTRLNPMGKPHEPDNVLRFPGRKPTQGG